MIRSAVTSAPPATLPQRTDMAFAPGQGANARSLVAAAIAIGRMPGEPAAVLPVRQRPHLASVIFGRKIRSPLADPRLEVIRAISAWLASGFDTIRADLVAEAAEVGWSPGDLSILFPGLSRRAEP